MFAAELMRLRSALPLLGPGCSDGFRHPLIAIVIFHLHVRIRTDQPGRSHGYRWPGMAKALLPLFAVLLLSTAVNR